MTDGLYGGAEEQLLPVDAADVAVLVMPESKVLLSLCPVQHLIARVEIDEKALFMIRVDHPPVDGDRNAADQIHDVTHRREAEHDVMRDRYAEQPGRRRAGPADAAGRVRVDEFAQADAGQQHVNVPRNAEDADPVVRVVPVDHLDRVCAQAVLRQAHDEKPRVASRDRRRLQDDFGVLGLPLSRLGPRQKEQRHKNKRRRDPSEDPSDGPHRQVTAGNILR
jgi:hypothetical protein